MKKLNLKDISKYVEENIGDFHKKRISSLDSLKLSRVLKRKNPYLFKAKYVLTAEKIIRGLVDAHISSNEETIFGDWLEGLAFISTKKFTEAGSQVLQVLIWSLIKIVSDILLTSNQGQIGAIVVKSPK